MKKIILIIGVLIISLFSGCFSQPTVIDFGFEKLQNYSEFKQLPDNTIVYYDNYTFILTNPTDKYKHGILGDNIESETLTYFNSNEIENVNKINVINFSPQVFEGLFPIVSDNLIITTLSGDGRGSQIVGFDFNGVEVFSSSVLSSGWRHVLGFENSYIINVVKPHVLGELEVLKIVNKSLVQVSNLNGYSTHRIGSRNLDIFEFYTFENKRYLILPTFDFSSVAVVTFFDGELKEVSRVEFDNEIFSIENVDGKIYVNDINLNIDEVLK